MEEDKMAEKVGKKSILVYVDAEVYEKLEKSRVRFIKRKGWQDMEKINVFYLL